MTEMVERVARSIYDSHNFHSPWEQASQEWHLICRHQARAAIAAMREPTEAMWHAGRDPVSTHGCVRDGWSVAKHVNEAFGGPPAWIDAENERLLAEHVDKGTCAVWTWRAMIDAALDTTE